MRRRAQWPYSSGSFGAGEGVELTQRRAAVETRSSVSGITIRVQRGGDVLTAVGGGEAGHQQEGTAPARIAPGIGHHRAVPLVIKAGVATGAATDIVNAGPQIFKRGILDS